MLLTVEQYICRENMKIAVMHMIHIICNTEFWGDSYCSGIHTQNHSQSLTHCNIINSTLFHLNFPCNVLTTDDWRFEGVPQLCPGGGRGGAFEPVRQHLSETIINHKAVSTFSCL